MNWNEEQKAAYEAGIKAAGLKKFVYIPPNNSKPKFKSTKVGYRFGFPLFMYPNIIALVKYLREQGYTSKSKKMPQIAAKLPKKYHYAIERITQFLETNPQEPYPENLDNVRILNDNWIFTLRKHDAL